MTEHRVIDKEKTCSRISEELQSQQISVSQLAEMLGVSQQTATNYMRGKSLPALPRFYKLSLIIGKSMDELIVINKDQVEVL